MSHARPPARIVKPVKTGAYLKGLRVQLQMDRIHDLCFRRTVPCGLRTNDVEVVRLDVIIAIAISVRRPRTEEEASVHSPPKNQPRTGTTVPFAPVQQVFPKANGDPFGQLVCDAEI